MCLLSRIFTDREMKCVSTSPAAPGCAAAVPSLGRDGDGWGWQGGGRGAAGEPPAARSAPAPPAGRRRGRAHPRRAGRCGRVQRDADASVSLCQPASRPRGRARPGPRAAALRGAGGSGCAAVPGRGRAPRAPGGPLCRPGAPCQREAVPWPHPTGTPPRAPRSPLLQHRGPVPLVPRPPRHVLTTPWGRALPPLPCSAAGPCPAPAPLPPWPGPGLLPDNQVLTEYHRVLFNVNGNKQLYSERGGMRSAEAARCGGAGGAAPPALPHGRPQQGRAAGSTRTPRTAVGCWPWGPRPPPATSRAAPGPGAARCLVLIKRTDFAHFSPVLL